LLSLEQTPPLAVPLRFFLTAPLFGVTAALLALWLGPTAMISRWQSGVLAFTHLLTLGYLAMVMFGALFQMLPVLVGVHLRSALPLARAIHALLLAGTLLLVGAFLGSSTIAFALAVGALALGVGGFIAVMARALWRAQSAHDTVIAIRLALLALGFTLVLGLWLIAHHVDPGLGLRSTLINLHLSWGLLGWVAVLLAGVAYQVVPMFQITQEYPPRLRRSLAWWVIAFLLIWTALFFLSPRWTWPAGLALALALTAFALSTLRLQQKRLRRLPDVTVDFWSLGMLCLIASAALWLIHEASPGALPDHLFALYWGALTILGGGVSVISGMLYKIIPFLVWLHLNNRLQEAGQWQGNLPTMRQIIADRRARLHLRLHAIALLLLLVAIAWKGMFYPAFIVLLASFGMQAWNLLGALRLYRKTLRHAV